jgi:hypothetical protein
MMRTHLMSTLLVLAVLAPNPVAAAALNSKGGGGGPTSGAGGAGIDDVLRRVERELDRLSRGVADDVANAERKAQRPQRTDPVPPAKQPPRSN